MALWWFVCRDEAVYPVAAYCQTQACLLAGDCNMAPYAKQLQTFANGKSAGMEGSVGYASQPFLLFSGRFLYPHRLCRT